MVWSGSICILSLVTAKLLEENIEKIFFFEISKHFLEMTLNSQYTKEKKNYILYFKNFSVLKDTVKRMKI